MTLLSDLIKRNLLISESKGVDHTLIICFAILCATGFIMITSATLDYALQEMSNSFHFIIKHLIYLSLGLFIATIITKIKLSFYHDYSKAFLDQRPFSFCLSTPSLSIQRSLRMYQEYFNWILQNTNINLLN